MVNSLSLIKCKRFHYFVYKISALFNLILCVESADIINDVHLMNNTGTWLYTDWSDTSRSACTDCFYYDTYLRAKILWKLLFVTHFKAFGIWLITNSLKANMCIAYFPLTTSYESLYSARKIVIKSETSLLLMLSH